MFSKLLKRLHGKKTARSREMLNTKIDEIIAAAMADLRLHPDTHITMVIVPCYHLRIKLGDDRWVRTHGESVAMLLEGMITSVQRLACVHAQPDSPEKASQRLEWNTTLTHAAFGLLRISAL